PEHTEKFQDSSLDPDSDQAVYEILTTEAHDGVIPSSGELQSHRQNLINYWDDFRTSKKREPERKQKVVMTAAARRLLSSEEDVQVAAPDNRTDVEAPVQTSDAEAEDSQYDSSGYDNNASEDLRHETDENSNLGWVAEGRAKKASAKMAMELAEA